MGEHNGFYGIFLYLNLIHKQAFKRVGFFFVLRGLHITYKL